MNTVLSARDAAYLSHKRAFLPRKLFMTIQGPISSISHILHCLTTCIAFARFNEDELAVVVNESNHLKIKSVSLTLDYKLTLLNRKSELFLILELDSSIFVLIKDFHLEWKDKLEINCRYVFRNLRLTLLEKGIYRPHPIFMVWASSSFIKVTDDEIPTVSIQTWLEKNCIKDFVAIDYPLTKVAYSNPHDQLHSYEGTLTSIDEELKGFYMMDGKIGLYVGSFMPSDIRNKLKLHTKVVIYNAHLIKGSQLSFVCCVKTNLKIESQGIEQSINKESAQESSLSEFDKYGMNMKEFDKVHKLQDKLVKLGRSQQESTILTVRILREYFVDERNSKKLNLVDYFIFHEEMCPYLNFSFSRCCVPNVLDLTSLKIEPISSLPVPMCLNDHYSKRWTFQFIDSKVLIGRIQISSSGQTFFQDDTDNFPLVLLYSSKTYSCDETKANNIALASPHSCSESCLKVPKLGTKIVCPILTSTMTGKLVSVGQFSVIYESFNSTGASGSDCLRYLSFSLCDCIILEDSNKSSSKKNPSKTLPTCSSNHDSEKLTEAASMYFHVTEKHALKYSNKTRGETQFDLVGYEFSTDVFDNYNLAGEVGETNSRKNNVKDENTASFNRNDLATIIKAHGASNSNCDDQVIDNCSTLFRPTTDSLKRLKLSKTNAEGTRRSEKNSHSAYDANCHSNSVNPERLKPLLLSFSQGYYHSLISQGLTYKLSATKHQSSNPFQATFLNSKLLKAAEQCHVRFQILAPLEMTLTRLPQSLCTISSVIPGRPLYSVQEILANSFSDCLVSFQAVVIHQEYCTLSLNNLNIGSHNIKLEVMDLELLKKAELYDADKISVYIDVLGLVPILGLIPGSLVHFYSLERKVSRSGKVYVRFIAVSSAQVIAFHDIRGFKLSNTQQTYQCLENGSPIVNITTLPKELLINLSFVKSAGLICIDCHICMFFKLGIKVICVDCKGIVQKQKCQGTACAKSSFSVVTSAVTLLDDGSGQASATFRGPTLVRQLLTLRDKQWDDLVESVTEQGEIILTKINAYKGLSPLTCFLDALINSPVVLRPCRIAVGKLKVSTAVSVDAMTMEELVEKDERVGQNVIKTLSLPMLKLDGHAIQSLD